MEESYDVILLFGSPFCGKSTYYRHTLQATHQRVSAKELFQENPQMGLRQVILKVASLLRNGIKVVIDDENWSKATRLSYIKTLRNKLPRCRFLCIKFNPEEILPYWLMEWYLAEKALCHDLSSVSTDLKKAEGRINQWFRKPVDETTGTRLEEVSGEEPLILKNVKTKLVAEVDYKFEVPALFMQWQAIIKPNSSPLEIHLELIDVIKCWLNTNPWGRVIIIFDGTIEQIDSTNQKDDSEENSITKDDYKPILKSLCQEISAPIYTFHLQTTTSDRTFCCPPQPGILAFLQRLHLLNLFHRQTLYLHCTESHAKMAEEGGVKHASAKGILRNPQMVIKSNAATKVVVKIVLKDIEVKERVKGERGLPMIPLFDEAKDAGIDGDWGYFEEKMPWKYVHAVCFKNVDVLERYQNLYAETASHISETGTKMIPVHASQTTKHSIPTQSSQSVTSQKGQSSTQTSARAIPSWLVPKSDGQRKSGNSLFSSPSHKYSSKEQTQKKICTQPSTVYCMNVLELIETAQSVLLKSGESSDAIVEMTKTNSKSKEDATRKEEAEDDNIIPSHSTSVNNRVKKHSVKDDTDIFALLPPNTKRSPPKMHENQERQQQNQAPHQFVPETITTIPETAEFQSSSTCKGNNLLTSEIHLSQPSAGSKDKSDNKQKITEAGPDLSFLDDIF